MLSWTTIRSVLIESTVTKVAMATVAIIPFLMKLAVLVDGRLGNLIEIPFNLEMLFFAGCLFSIAYLIYALRCPHLISKAPIYGAISSGKHSEEDLRGWFHEIVRDKRRKPDPKLILQYLSIAQGFANLTSAQAAELLSGSAGHAIMDPFWATAAGPRLGATYQFARGTADQSRWSWRLIASIVCYLAFTCLLAIEIYNGHSVYEYFHAK